jgi:hypothetical protein
MFHTWLELSVKMTDEYNPVISYLLMKNSSLIFIWQSYALCRAKFEVQINSGRRLRGDYTGYFVSGAPFGEQIQYLR